VGEVEEEGPVRVLGDESPSLVGVATGERCLHRWAFHDLAVALEGHVPAVGRGIIARADAPGDPGARVHIVGVGQAEGPVEALVARTGAGADPEMPLADVGGRVAARLERLCERDLSGGQSALGVREEDPPVPGHAAARRVATRQERGPARRTDLRAGVEVREAHALGGHPVEVRRADRRAAVAAEVAVALVVGQDDDDVGGCRSGRAADGGHGEE
jgi:hypothetical protein